MRKKAIVLLMIFALVALTLVSVPVASAKTLKSSQLIEAKDWTPNADPDPRYPQPPSPDAVYGYWGGRVDFGDGLKGFAYFEGDWENTKYVPSHTGHFYEWFYMAFDNGEWIMGNDHGTYNYASNFMYMANGWVTDASDNLQYLIGCKYHEEGKTTDPNDPLATEIVGTGTCFLAGA